MVTAINQGFASYFHFQIMHLLQTSCYCSVVQLIQTMGHRFRNINSGFTEDACIKVVVGKKDSLFGLSDY